MFDWAMAHPVLFTILALPVVIVGCLIVLSVFIEVDVRRGK